MEREGIADSDDSSSSVAFRSTCLLIALPGRLRRRFPGDMLKFVAALNAGKLIPLPLLADATKNQKAQFGYGFISSSFENFPYWGHGGGAPGNSLVLDYYPVTDTRFICMSNRDPPICDRLALNYLFRSPRQP